MFASDTQLRKQFEETLESIKGDGVDVRFMIECDFGPDLVEGYVTRYFAFYQRGYNQAKLDFLKSQL